MSFQHIGKGALRVAKNYTKGYSDVQSKVRDATSNDPWGPSGTQMNDIAQMTYNQNDFVEIMEMLDKRLNDKGKNWRHVFKALTVLDYCLHAGSENTVIYFKDNLYVIKTLKEFQYVDEYGKDQGANVRQKAKDISNLLMDDARLREERRSRATMRDRMVRGVPGEAGEFGEDELENENRRRAQAQQMLGAPRSKTKEDDEMRRAIEASKRSLADDERRKGEENDLAKAIALSEKEEAERKRALQAGGSLFDDQAGPGPSTNGANSGGDLLIDFNAASPQQPLQPQFTSFNPYSQLAQQQAMQDQYLRQQAEWEAMQQAQAQAQAQAQQEAWQQQQLFQAQAQAQAQQDEWNRQQLMLQQQAQQQQQQQFMMQQQQQMQMQSPLMAQPTGYGSNNPFAMMGGGAPQSPPVQTPAPSMSPFPSISSPSIAQHSPSPQPSLTPSNSMANARRTPANDGANSHLANLLANREDGMDTFGNMGQLRFGHGQTAQRLATQQTGHNPFGQPQQQQNEQPFFTV
ncbi:unnamed protein product [Rhizoctonia solani]|uniref:ENTH domain-containing protein n=1 Tax=Rhizoctonia solani TaxID=456999 RepID=A0A8H3CB55_9AGAM|nr:unnamed protein product [Rhizoctonia solani]CAE6501648.1 unnamed protein product [Rhizoctonia solani]